MRNVDAESSVPDLIHETKCDVGPEPIEKMVLDENGSPDDPFRFLQQSKRVGRMVQDINKRHDVEAVVEERESEPVKRRNQDARLASGQDIDAVNTDIAALLVNRLGQ